MADVLPGPWSPWETVSSLEVATCISELVSEALSHQRDSSVVTVRRATHVLGLEVGNLVPGKCSSTYPATGRDETLTFSQVEE